MASIRGDQLEFRIGDEVGSLRCSEATVTIQRRRLWTDMEVSGATGTVTLRRLPEAKAVRFREMVRLRGSAALVRRARASLQELMERPGYLTRRRAAEWAALARALLEPLADLSTFSYPAAMATEAAMLEELRRTLRDPDAQIADRNAAFVDIEARRFATLFETVERHPLSARQVEAILHDEDHALVVAGAGTGKTSTVVGKIAYLLQSGIAQEHEILALAYNRKAAVEMAERARARIGRTVEVRTFHALGLQIITDVDGKQPAVSALAAKPAQLSKWIAHQLDDLLLSPELRDLYIDFAVWEREYAKALTDFTSLEEYQRYKIEQEPRTLTGIKVRSSEERLLADWLTVHGVQYEYERPYEHDTTTVTARQYRPDFYLPRYRLYVEHFGVDRDGNTASFVAREKYERSMTWKRNLHARYGTRLLETFSYERMEGTYRDVWRTKFEDAGVTLTALATEELKALLGRSVRTEIADLLGKFLVMARETVPDRQELRAAVQGREDAHRCTAFLALFEEIHTRYEAYLTSRREVDFAEMVARAASLVESGRYAARFRRIIVDEFQDISRGRLRLLQALLRATPDARILCVGDDWQSIYGFAGSDVGTMVRFTDTFGHTKRTDLDRTFRFNDRLLAATSQFVQQNPLQLRKTLRAHVTRPSPAITVVYGANGGLDVALQSIMRDDAFTGSASVLVLGRYNATMPKNWEQVVQQYPMLQLSCLTVHKSKGLEADYVVVLDVAAKRHGFPSQVASDGLLTLVVAANGEMRHAEERRLFYVALTRARHRAFVCAPLKTPSVFATELEGADYTGLVTFDGERVKRRWMKTAGR